MKKLFTVVFLITVLAFCADVFAPQLAEEGLYQALHKRMELQRSDIAVQASPGFKIYEGTLDEVTVQGKNVRFGKLILSSFDCHLNSVRFSPWNSLTTGALSIRQAGSGELDAAISGDNLRQFVVDNVKDIKDAQVEIANDKIIVRGTVSLGGVLRARAQIEGRFAIKQEKLLFIPSYFIIKDMGLERSLSIDGIDVYDFSDFPLGIRPDSVTMNNGVLTIHGKVGN